MVLPAWLLAALATAAIAAPTTVAVVTLALPFARQWLNAHLTKQEMDILKAAVKGAYLVVSKFAPTTATTLDDQLALLLLHTDEEFQAATGKPMTTSQKIHAAKIGMTMHADPKYPDLKGKADDPLAVLHRFTSRLAASGSGAHRAAA